MAEPTLIAVLADVPDPRDPRGLIHPLPAVLSLAVVAMLAGMKTLEAVAQFGRDRPALAFALGFRRAKTPNKSALSKLLRRLDASRFEAALARWLSARGAGGEALALDGKALRGSASGGLPGVHLLAAFAPHAAAVVGQLRVDAKTNEHKAALELLGVLPLAGRVVTADAMFTHRDVCEAVLAGGGDYVLPAGDNQPTLKADVAAAFDDAAFPPLPAPARPGRAAVGGHGRQGARAAGAAVDRDDGGAQRLPGLAGRGAGVPAGAGAGGRRHGDARGGVRRHQPDAGRGGRGAVAGADPGALVGREPAVRRAGRDPG